MGRLQKTVRHLLGKCERALAKFPILAQICLPIILTSAIGWLSYAAGLAQQLFSSAKLSECVLSGIILGLVISMIIRSRVQAYEHNTIYVDTCDMLQKCSRKYVKTRRQFVSLHKDRRNSMDVKEYESSLESSAKEFLQQIVDTVSEVASDYTGHEVCACIKVIEPLHRVDETYKWKDAGTRTLCRSDNTPQNRISSSSDGTYPLEQNTDFRLFFDEVYRLKIDPEGLVTGDGSYFYVTNLKEFDDALHERRMRLDYANSRKHYDDYYLGTVVVPIRSDRREIPYAMTEGEEILGFICLDTKNGNIFNQRRKDTLLSILEAASPSVYEVMSDYRYYWYKDIKGIDSVKTNHSSQWYGLLTGYHPEGEISVQLDKDMAKARIFVVAPPRQGSVREAKKNKNGKA